MMVAVSGFSAAGKTTTVRQLIAHLEERGVPHKVVRFSTLFPGSMLKPRRPKRQPKASQSGTVGLRSIEAMPGSWNRKFRIVDFFNFLGAHFFARCLSIIHRRKVLIFDRYSYDRLVNFDSRGLLIKLAKKLVCRPRITFVLIPTVDAHEARFLDRLKQRHSMEFERFSDEDRAELRMVHDLYQGICERFPETVRLNSSQDESHEELWQHLEPVLRRKKLIRD